MTREGTASLGPILPHFIPTIFIAVFPKTLDGLLTLLRESGRHSKKSVAIFLFLAIKLTLITAM